MHECTHRDCVGENSIKTRYILTESDIADYPQLGIARVHIALASTKTARAEHRTLGIAVHSEAVMQSEASRTRSSHQAHGFQNLHDSSRFFTVQKVVVFRGTTTF